MEKQVRSCEEIKEFLKSRNYIEDSSGNYINGNGANFTKLMFRLCGQRFEAEPLVSEIFNCYHYILETTYGRLLFRREWLDGKN